MTKNSFSAFYICIFKGNASVFLESNKLEEVWEEFACAWLETMESLLNICKGWEGVVAASENTLDNKENNVLVVMEH